jgi:hypothetical protein
MMTERPRITVSCHDPVDDTTQTQELDPNSYVLVLGENMEVGSLARHANGTVQLTLKRVKP